MEENLRNPNTIFPDSLPTKPTRLEYSDLISPEDRIRLAEIVAHSLTQYSTSPSADYKID